jgi:hypothetical protein
MHPTRRAICARGLCLSIAIPGCATGSSKADLDLEPTTVGEEVANEFLGDDAIRDAIADADFVVNEGGDPPGINGRYNLVGRITESNLDTADRLLNTVICYYNQNTDGTISYSEPSTDSYGQGDWITGTGSNFTIYEDVSQGTCMVYLMFSGTQQDGGDLTTEHLLVYSEGCGDTPDGSYEKGEEVSTLLGEGSRDCE